MKVVIFHDYIGTIGGGEKLVLTLARELKADIITTDMDIDSIKKMEFEDVNIISLGETIKLPPLKQISTSIKFAMCDFSKKYDYFIFSGNWAPFAAKKHKPNLYYCHTPVRAFYDTYHLLLERQPIYMRPFFVAWVYIHRHMSRYYIGHIERIVTNSKNTLSRVERYLHRNDARIIYPPVNTKRYNFKGFGDFWLSVNRLYPEKRVDLQIEAFRNMPKEKLIIVGGYAKGDHAAKYAEEIIHNVPPNVEIYGSITEEKLTDLYSRCKGFIATAVDEDFGMTPIEAMAAGKPVICTREGGYLETVNNETGILIGPNVSDIIDAVNIISNDPTKFREKCIERAKMFDIEIFVQEMKKEIFSRN